MNKIKKFLMCLLMILIPLYSHATKTIREDFLYLYGFNKKLLNDRVIEVYDIDEPFYNKLSVNYFTNKSDLKIFDGKYKFISNNNVCDNADFIFEIDLGHRNINNNSINAKNFNITNIALKTYFSYNINNNERFRNALNFGLATQGNFMFEVEDKINFKQIDTVAFTQYYNRMIFGIFKIENTATIGYSYSTIKNLEVDNRVKLSNLPNIKYFDASLKTRLGLDILTNYIDINTYLSTFYNVMLNNNNISSNWQHDFIVGLENEFSAGMFGIKLDIKYNLKNEALLFGGSISFKF